MNTVFSWMGEPIEDIEQWARDRGERMMVLTTRIRHMNPYVPGGSITYSTEVEEMPESFTFQAFTQDRMIVSCVPREEVGEP